MRVRWNKKRSEVGFSIGLHADPSKWNADSQRPVRGSTHVIGQKRIPSRVINDRIDEFLVAIKESFVEYGLKDIMPEPDELRELVNEKVGRGEDLEEEPQVKPLKEIFDDFLASGKKERDWTSAVHYKYEQVWKHLTQCDPTVSLETLDKDKMLELKDWYVKNNYKNRTINKQFRFLKSFLRWMKANGYPVHESAIDCQIHLTVTKKNVTFLTFKELMQFYHFKFAPEHNYLDKARDMFCFMAFTSLRYSDLAQLKRANITSRGIELYTKKTSTPITIPIIDYAQEIIDKYDYVPNMAARSLVGKSSRIIALLLPVWYEDTASLLFNPYMGQLVGSLDMQIRKAGYYSMLCSFNGVEEALSFQRNWQIDGSIMVDRKSVV